MSNSLFRVRDINISDEMGSMFYLDDAIEDAANNGGCGGTRWTRQCVARLHKAEKAILSSLKTPYKLFYVEIGSVVGANDKIWTIAMNREAPKCPLVLIHGMGAGLALWCPNFDAFAATRPVYAIDLLGFGRSSRPKFSKDPLKAEEQWVDSIEEWRKQMKLEQIILLGHSLGGYLATVYAMKYPQRVRHLIPADPWGYPERPPVVFENEPLWRRVFITAMEPLNPLSPVRAAGPAGKWLVKKTRPDLPRKFEEFVKDSERYIPEYIYQCNSQTPSGESAFHTLMLDFAWSKHPLILRTDELDPSLPISIVFGSKSWVDNNTGAVLRQKRPPKSETFVEIIEDSSHFIYLDKPNLFNDFVLNACARADCHKPRTSTTPLPPYIGPMDTEDLSTSQNNTVNSDDDNIDQNWEIIETEQINTDIMNNVKEPDPIEYSLQNDTNIGTADIEKNNGNIPPVGRIDAIVANMKRIATAFPKIPGTDKDTKVKTNVGNKNPERSKPNEVLNKTENKRFNVVRNKSNWIGPKDTGDNEVTEL